MNMTAIDCIGRSESEFVPPERARDPTRGRAVQPSPARLRPSAWRSAPTPDGRTEWFLVHRIPISGETGAVETIAIIERDVTERKLMEMRLRQADKMQALGTLAGGIAHDFNNLLMAVLGSLDLASRRAPDDPRLNRLLQNATYAAERGASLTQRLLSFSRQRDLSLRAVDVNQVISGNERPADAHARWCRADRKESLGRSLARDGRSGPARTGDSQPLHQRARRDAGERHDFPGDPQRDCWRRTRSRNFPAATTW